MLILGQFITWFGHAKIVNSRNNKTTLLGGFIESGDLS
jgi:hypothetical protein